MADLASLGLRIDTSEAAKAVTALNKLSAAGKTAEQQADKTGSAWTGAGQQINQANAGVAQGASSAAKATTAASAAAGTAAKNYGAFAAGQKLSAYQSQQLSFQLNDLFVQVASGQSPLTALIQQGSQLNGTFGGLTGTLRAVSSIFTVTRVAIGGVVGVLTGLAVAVYQGAEQSKALERSLLLTGNAAGVTEGQFNSLARSVADSSRTTIGGARETLQSLVSSGRFTGEALESAAKAAQGLSRVTGQSNDDIVASFVKASDNVTAFATTTNKQYNFLTAAQLAYIKTLEDQGRVQEALAVTFNALNTRIDVASGNLGSLERGWNSVKIAASNAINAMLQIGRATTPQDAVSNIEAQIAALENRKSNNPALTAARKSALQEQLALAQAATRETEKQAAASARTVQTEQAKTAFSKLQEQFQSKAAKRTQEIADATAKAKNAGASPADLAQVVKGINERYKDSTAGASAARLDAKAILARRIEDVKSAGQQELDTLNDQERILEAQRSARLVDDQTYYDRKTQIVRDTTKARIDVLTAENKLLNAQGVTGRDDTDRDRQVIKNQTEINKLQAQGATQVTVLGIQSKAATASITRGYEDARAAAQSFLDLQQKQYDRDVQAQSLSAREQQRAAALAQIEDKYEQQRQQLESERRRGQLQPGQYDAELAIINEFQRKAGDSYVAYYDRITAAQGDWENGAKRGYANYLQSAADVAGQTEALFTNAFTGLEDVFVKFATTGKLSFKDLANSIIADLVRIQARQLIAGGAGKSALGLIGSIAGLFGGTSGVAGVANALPGDSLDNFIGLAGLGKRAIGGPTSAGGMYEVLENGPELLNVGGKQLLMMGNQHGSVEPISAGAAAGGSTPNVTLINQTTGRADDMQVDWVSRGELRVLLRENTVQERRFTDSNLRNPNGRYNDAVSRSFRAPPRR